MFHKILVPLDGSEIAEAVLPQVGELARCTGAQVTLLSVISTPSYQSLFADSMLSPQARNEQNLTREHAEGYLQRVEPKYLTGVKASAEVVGGPVAETILDYAMDGDYDLIAMSTHGRRGVARAMIGSVTDEIVRRSHLPVLVVRGEDKGSAAKS